MNNLLNLSILNMLGIRRKRRGTMWTSLIVAGISALVYGMTRGNLFNNKLPFQNMMKNSSVNPQVMSTPALAEFSEELLANALKKDKK